MLPSSYPRGLHTENKLLHTSITLTTSEPEPGIGLADLGNENI
jgi:hypothetical protein